jgi:hypothetical protein
MNELDKEQQIESLIQKKEAELVPEDVFEEKINPDDFTKPDIEDRAAIIVKELHDKAMLKKVMENPEIKERIFSVAENTIDNEIGIIGNTSKKRHQDSSYRLNQEACENYGVDESVPNWQQRMMVIGSSFWFVIYWIFASFSIAPVSVFNRGLKTFLKRNWITIPVAILCYLIIVVGVPLLIRYLSI